jgi:hypothetical protein
MFSVTVIAPVLLRCRQIFLEESGEGVAIWRDEV